MAANAKITVVGSKMTIEVDLDQDLGPSASGKTNIVATTGGNQPVPGHEGTFVGLNVYKYAQPKRR